jgi:hypothetical protein
MELINGSELFDRIVEKGFYSEKNAQGALSYLSTPVPFPCYRSILPIQFRFTDITVSSNALFSLSDLYVSSGGQTDLGGRTILTLEGHCSPRP